MQSTRQLRWLPDPGASPLGPWPGEFLGFPGGHLHVRRVPDGRGGEPAVFVHGLGGASTNWTDLAWLLADVVDGIALDLPGFGLSDPPPGGDYRLATHVRAVEAVVGRAGAPVHLFGNSLGGAVCVRLAAAQPRLVRSLTLISPALPDFAPWRLRDPRLGVLLLPGLRELAAARIARGSPQVRAERVIRLCYADASRVPRVRVEQAAAEISRRDQLEWTGSALVRSLSGLVRAQLGPAGLWASAQRIQAPTLLIWGRRDRLVHHSVGRRAVRKIPGARLLVLPDCGHVAQMEAPMAVAQAWIEQVSGSRIEQVSVFGMEQVSGSRVKQVSGSRAEGDQATYLRGQRGEEEQ